jgi:hypothetical protein
MFDLELENGDIKLENGDALLLSDAERVAQAIDVHLQTIRGEWFLDRTHGVPYFDEILGKSAADIDVLEAVIRSEILGVDGVNAILSWRASVNRATRVVSIEFAADTIYGPIEYEGEMP